MTDVEMVKEWLKKNTPSMQGFNTPFPVLQSTRAEKDSLGNGEPIWGDSKPQRLK